MASRMHVEIETISPILDKINTGATLNAEDISVLNGLTEKTIKDIFDWIQDEKKRDPNGTLVAEQ